MAQMDTAARIEQLLDNEYAQEQLREGVKNLRAAYERASKRRVKKAQDKRLRRQLQSAAASIAEAARAFQSGRQKPKPRWGRRLLLVGGLAGAATGVAVVLKNGGEASEEPSVEGDVDA
jgi:hypothetical protein